MPLFLDKIFGCTRVRNEGNLGWTCAGVPNVSNENLKRA